MAKQFSFSGKGWAVGALAALAVIGFGCNKDDGDNSEPIPYVFVNEQVNLSSIEFSALRNDNGTATIPGGVRGIIIVRQNPNLYYAFERNCTFRVYDSCAVVSDTPARLFLHDACCGSEFNYDGTVRNGPATRALLRYTTQLNGTMLYITN